MFWSISCAIAISLVLHSTLIVKQACREMEKMREELKKAKAEAGGSDSDKKTDDEMPTAEPTKPDSAKKEKTAEESTEKAEEDQTISEVAESKSKPSPKATPKTSKAAAKKEAQSEDSKVKASSRSSTPCRELDDLTSVPKHLVVDEQDVLYSNTGRVQRNRKKPTIYDPKTGPDSGWKGEDGDTPAAAEAPAKLETPAVQPEKPPPKKRGPKPGKKKKKKKVRFG